MYIFFDVRQGFRIYLCWQRIDDGYIGDMSCAVPP
jgi:hypothetical protein